MCCSSFSSRLRGNHGQFHEAENLSSSLSIESHTINRTNGHRKRNPNRSVRIVCCDTEINVERVKGELMTSRRRRNVDRPTGQSILLSLYIQLFRRSAAKTFSRRLTCHDHGIVAHVGVKVAHRGINIANNDYDKITRANQ